MNKIVKLVSITMIMVLLTIGLTSCYGNFSATRKVYDFNGSFGDKWVNQFMFWVLIIVPAYEVAAFADVVLFNTIEFWTGSNPMAMAADEEIIKYAHENGKNLKITINQNHINVEDMDNPTEQLNLSYKPLEKSWYYESADGMVKIATLSADKADFFHPSGKVITMNKPL